MTMQAELRALLHWWEQMEPRRDLVIDYLDGRSEEL